MGPAHNSSSSPEYKAPTSPPPGVSMEAPPTMGLAANDDDDRRTPSPQKQAETLGEASCTEETMKEDSALAPPAQELCSTGEKAEIDAEDKAASLQAAEETLPGGTSVAEPPGLER